MEHPLPLAKTIWRILTFQATEEELANLDWRFLAVGFVATWLVGMGRYWDSPTAEFGQHMGFGSLVYVVVLAAMLFVIAHPLRPVNWSYRNVLTFITMTSFPAALYAIPVERWVPVETAITMNIAFLALVAVYRVGLYLFYMHRLAQLGTMAALTAVFLPITIIISFITISGYAQIVFDIMGGLRDREATPEDGVNGILMFITMTSCITVPFWMLIYGWMINDRSHMRGHEISMD